MSDEIAIYDEELTELEEFIRRGIEGLQKLSGDARGDKVFELENRINRAKQVFASFKVELRDLPKSDLAEYEGKGKQHQQAMQKLIQDLNFAKTESDRAELLEGRSVQFNPDTLNANQLVDKGKETLQESEQSLQRSKKLVEQSKQIGRETNVRLEEQTQQIKATGEQIQQVESNLKKADRVIRQIVRKVMTDKIIMCLLCMITLAVVFIIIYKIAVPDADINLPDEITQNPFEDNSSN